jgi:hypothetical protein
MKADSQNIQAQHPSHEAQCDYGHNDVPEPLPRGFRFGAVRHGLMVADWANTFSTSEVPQQGNERVRRMNPKRIGGSQPATQESKNFPELTEVSAPLTAIRCLSNTL